MSTQQGKLCSLLLLELFGQTVQKVGDDLFKWRARPLQLIMKSTNLTQSEVRQSLCVLIQYGFVTFNPSHKVPSLALYSFVYDKVLLTLRYPKFILLIKKKFGNEAEIIVEDILRLGHDTASKIIVRAASRFRETNKTEEMPLVLFRDKFIELVNHQFLMRCLCPGEDVAVPILVLDDKDLFSMPRLNMKILSEISKGNRPDDGPGDKGILWEVNFERFNQEIRDELMISAISSRVDENGGQLMKYFLEEMYLRTDPWVDVSNPIPFNALREKLKQENTHPKLVEYLDAYTLILIEDPSNFVKKTCDGGGGQYVVNIEEAITQLTWVTLENVVLERFGSKAARIFRIVKTKKKIDQDQIQPIAMIPAKEAKSVTYQLLGENFLQIEELRKTTTSNGPVKTFFAFHINLNLVARMVLDMCYKAVYNLMLRREHEVNDNKRLIDKHHRIKSISQNMREQGASEEQIAEIEEMITPIEVSLVEKVEKMITGINAAELQVDNTIFILQLFLMYQEGQNKK